MDIILIAIAGSSPDDFVWSSQRRTEKELYIGVITIKWCTSSENALSGYGPGALEINYARGIRAM